MEKYISDDEQTMYERTQNETIIIAIDSFGYRPVILVSFCYYSLRSAILKSD